MRQPQIVGCAHRWRDAPFAYWTPADWATRGEEACEIAENQLGWDITDFGQSWYETCGLFLFTIRNGSLAELKARRSRLYCEKLMVVGSEQVTPMHSHWNKVEDIINRGGGKLVIQLLNATADDGLAHSAITVSIDGVKRGIKAADQVLLALGGSITLPQRVCHRSWGRESAFWWVRHP